MNNAQDSNSVLDLIFLYAESEEFDKYEILPDLQSLLDHTSLLVSIIIEKEFIQEKRQFIIKNSNKEKNLSMSLGTG